MSRAPGSCALALALLLVPTGAWAASPSKGTGFELRMGVGFAATSRMPDLRLTEDLGLPSRELVKGTLPTTGGFRGFGGYVDTVLVLRPHVSVPLGGFGIYAPVGDHAPVRSAVDGSIATVQPWRMFAVDVLGPGLGLRTTHRRYFFEASLRVTVLAMGGRAEIAAGRAGIDADVLGFAVGARAELSACRRLDPESRVCLSFAPRLYEVRPMSGASLNLSWIWGH